MNKAIARCNAEITEILNRPDVIAGIAPAWLVTLGILDWTFEKELIRMEPESKQAIGEETPLLEPITPTDLLFELMQNVPDLPVVAVRYKRELFEVTEDYQILEPNQDPRFPGGAIVIEVK